jgi:hypothetical protein
VMRLTARMPNAALDRTTPVLENRLMHRLIPFLVLAPSVALSGATLPTQLYEDWTAASAQNMLIAATNNSAGDTLAEFCYQDGHCEWRFSAQVQCDPTTKGLVLINGEEAYDWSAVTCLGQLVDDKSEYTYRIENWKALEGVLAETGEVAIVLPMKETMVKVFRFSTKGAIGATAYIGGPIVGERQSVGEARQRQSSDTTL